MPACHHGGAGSIPSQSIEICGGQRGTGTGASASTSVSPLGIISTTLLTHLRLHVAFTRRTDGRTLEALSET